MRIGELSRATGVSTRALRYYGEQRLLVGERLANGYRDYADDAPETVAFIQDLFGAGLPSEVVRDALAFLRGDPGAAARTELRTRVVRILDRLEEQEQQIARRRRTLEAYLAQADVCVAPDSRTCATSMVTPGSVRSCSA